MNEFVGILASKYDSDLGGTESIFNLAGGANATLTFTIPNNYVFYLMEFAAISTTSDTTATIRDQSTNTIYSFSEIPDVDSKVINYPFMTPHYQKKITVLFQNNAGVTSTITFRIYGILVPDTIYREFEKKVYGLVEGIDYEKIKSIAESVVDYDKVKGIVDDSCGRGGN